MTSGCSTRSVSLDCSRFATCIVHLSDLAQVLALGPHQFVGAARELQGS